MRSTALGALFGLALGATVGATPALAALPVAFQPMLQRAEAGDAATAFQLAQRLEHGEPGVLARDEVLARRLYRIAAERGHMGAACNLGAMLMDGQGGPVDLAAGAQWFRRAALRGHGLAQYNLGVMHALGDGVPRDDAEALAWLEQAVAWLPDPESRELARAWRSRLLDRMGPGQMGKARFRIQELADQIARAGDPPAPGAWPHDVAAARLPAGDGLSRARPDPIPVEALARAERRSSARVAAAAASTSATAAPTTAAPLTAATVTAATVTAPSTAAASTAASPPLQVAATGPTPGMVAAVPPVLAAVAPAVPAPSMPATVAAAAIPAAVAEPAPPVRTRAARPSPEVAVRQWAEAWGRQRADDYLAFYDASFVPPDGEERAEWETQRRQRITRPDWLRLRVDDIVTTVEGDHARTRFLQVHVVPPHRVDVSRKTLRWVWRDDAWRIESEQAEPLRGKGGRSRARGRSSGK